MNTNTTSSRKIARSKQQDGHSREARRLAAAILEVLAGMRTPTEVAQALSISVPRYYALEQRALENLVAACEPRSRGPVKSPQKRVAELEQEVQRLRRQCDRHLALARASQRMVGLSMPAKSTATGNGNSSKKSPAGKKRRKRRPTVRALKAAEALRDTPPDQPTPGSSVAETVSATTNA